ncbi:hypothetical protein NZ698_07630 [Chryseobacterium sp. PBS4-4]|uniref:Uncharacterized protein n=1 Tax=Chryseobacterium edaphi TaxID=2976532 RepID=A0ABT2W4C5_9FLAO|nr:hypothetical protein [Chryseobacterium edaphi]MCU7617064.1 hypothetical protein [Chryseobacterium edaphi]
MVAKNSLVNVISSLNGKGSQPESSFSPSLYINTYVLSKKEKDSIWNTIFSENKTQHLFKNFQTSKDEKIYLIKNQINLFAILNSNSVNSQSKTELLIGKFKYDQKYSTENKDIQTYGTYGLRRHKIINISSKEKASIDFLNIYMNSIDSDNKINLFTQERIILIGVDDKKEEPVQAIEIFKKDKFNLKKLRNKLIVGAEVNSYKATIGNDLLLIYYKK